MVSRGKKERKLYIDILKIVAIILIIITHDSWALDNSELLIFPLVIDMAVPIFMIVSGYNYANGNHLCLKEEYKALGMRKRLNRILLPFFLVFFSMVLLLIIVKNEKYTFVSLLIDLVKGGYGPGAYYTPIMVQFILFVPLIWYIYKKYTILAIFLVNLLFEVIYTVMQLDEKLYQFLLLRYVFFIALGFEMKTREKEGRKRYCEIFLFIIGIFYLVGSKYLYEPIVFRRWTTTSMISGFYIWPCLLAGQRFFEGREVAGRLKDILTICSNATFHIYLVQMMYYYIGVSRVFGAIPASIRIICNVLICVSGGVFFYWIMNNVQKALARRKKNTYE